MYMVRVRFWHDPNLTPTNGMNQPVDQSINQFKSYKTGLASEPTVGSIEPSTAYNQHQPAPPRPFSNREFGYVQRMDVLVHVLFYVHTRVLTFRICCSRHL